MKKFFEAPEVSSVELTQTDVIMTASVEPGAYTIADPNSGLASFKKAVDQEYNMWKGLN